ncbi:MAG: hypothetical protein AXA67_11205 [Methylothermaceae bacteria B42]|nr:MAG: hypothetical protein AXA67_11205 [Methylothermaceae bacteria B42]HHJ39100.1 HAD family phosphatase [Methylothermaceae bacterium]
MALPHFEAVILDLDGLILDTEPTYARAWQQAARELGFDLSDSLCQSLKGCHIEAVQNQLQQAFGPDFDIPAFHDLSTRLWRQWVEAHGIATKPGYRELMDFLKNAQIPYALATNSQRQYAEKCMALADILDDFPLTVTRDEVASGKPAPDIYLQAAKMLGTPPVHCLAVEDSGPGILAAHQAGTKPVLIPDSAPVACEIEALAIATLPSLESLVSQLTAKFP